MSQCKLWWLRDYANASGNREVRRHYDRASDEVKAEFDVHWEMLQARPRSEWGRPAAAKLRPEVKNGYRDFFEFRFSAEKVQQRPIGYFGPGDAHFTLLIWATEKGNKFVPPDTIKTCNVRRSAVAENAHYAAPWDEEEYDEQDQTLKTEAKKLQRLIR